MSKAIDAIENATFLDQPAERLAGAASKLFPGPMKDLASGTALGHPLHPVLTAVPTGFWTSATLIDFVGGKKGRKMADRLVLAGLVSALPTAWTGISDWSDTRGKEMRVGAIHAVGNTAGLLLYSASYLARKKGKRGKGVRLALMGATAIGGSGYLGGHLAFRLGVGVDQTVFDKVPDGWVWAMAEDSLLEGSSAMAKIDGVDVMVYRTSGEVFAIADRCTHRGAPLHEGKVDQMDCTVTCPWHASKFSLETGAIINGPATAPQPVYEARIEAGQIQVRGQ